MKQRISLPLTTFQTANHVHIYARMAIAKQSGGYSKSATGKCPNCVGRQPGKQKANDVAFQRSSKKALFRSARGGRNLGFFIGQFAEDGGNLFKFGRLIKEEIGPGTQAFLAIL